MRRRSDGWNIVLAGFWNRMIFTPEWVAEHVFNDKEFETYVAFLPVLPVVFKGRSVSLEVSLARLLFRPRKLMDDSDFLRAEGMARAVLHALPETPMQAVGINFSYVEDFPPDSLRAVFNDRDTKALDALGWAIQERKLSRRLTQGDSTLNLTMSFEGSAVTFDLNYHTEATSNVAALDAVKEWRVTELRRQGLKLLLEAFDLEFEEGSDDDNS